METTIVEKDKNTSVFIHISIFLKYFFPFANFIVPLIIWMSHKENAFVEANGKQALNFQISLMIYKILVGLLCVPFILIFASDFFTFSESFENVTTNWELQYLSGLFIFLGIAGIIFLSMFILELIVVINAAMHASKGFVYKYPLSIQFFKTIPQ